MADDRRNEDGPEGPEDAYTVEEDPPSTMSRRTFVKAGAAVAGAAWIGAFGGSVIRSLTTGEGSSDGPSSGSFVYHVPEGENPWYADLDGQEVLASEFPLGESAKVYVGGVKAILLRFDPGQLVDRTGTDMGFVAYSSTCTHLGCQVYFATGQTPAGEFPEGVIYCPCHQGAFDPFRSARVVYGPPPAPLPKVPLRVVDGRVEAV
jgi:rieske iron-sulfur protein